MHYAKANLACVVGLGRTVSEGLDLIYALVDVKAIRDPARALLVLWC